MIIFNGKENVNVDLKNWIDSKEKEKEIEFNICGSDYTITRKNKKIVITRKPFNCLNKVKVAEYSYSSDYWLYDIRTFIQNQIYYQIKDAGYVFNRNSMNLLFDNKKGEYTYLSKGFDYGYKIGVVDSMIVLITPEGEKIKTDCDIDNVSIDFLQIVLDSMIKKDLYVNEVLPI